MPNNDNDKDDDDDGGEEEENEEGKRFTGHKETNYWKCALQEKSHIYSRT